METIATTSSRTPGPSSTTDVDLERQQTGVGSDSQLNSTSTVAVLRSGAASSFHRFKFWKHGKNDLVSFGTVRPLTRFVEGYPNLAAFHDSSENFMIYRRFGYLQARVLLEKQDKLRLLEAELDEFDDQNKSCASSRQVNDDNEHAIKARSQLLDLVDLELTSYSQSLASAQQLMAFNKPSGPERAIVAAYVATYKPIEEAERSYLSHKEDLITLRPGRDRAWLDRTIERILQQAQRPFPFLHGLFASHETRQRNGGSDHFKDIHYYNRSRIEGLAMSLFAIAMLALLIVPIWLLYHITQDASDTVTAQNGVAYIMILLIATLLFSLVMSFFTRAQRHEILTANASYCAVLVVFLENIR